MTKDWKATKEKDKLKNHHINTEPFGGKHANSSHSFCTLSVTSTNDSPSVAARQSGWLMWGADGDGKTLPCFIPTWRILKVWFLRKSFVVSSQCCVNFCCTAKWPRYTYIYIYIYIIFHIFFHYGLSEETEYSSLCYTLGPCLSVLYIIVCIFSSHTPSPFTPPFSPPCQPQVSSLCLWVCICF